MRRMYALAAGLVALAATTCPAAPAGAAPGSLLGIDGVLFEGCHEYPYSYAVTPVSTPWYLETFLVGPDGRRLSSDLFISDGDATSGTASFGICSRATPRGTFRIEGQLTTTSGTTQTTEPLASTSFSLGQPGTRTTVAVADRTPRRGDRVRFVIGSTRQAPEGWIANDLATVMLQKRMPEGWRRVGGGKVETNAEGRTRVRITWPGGRERYRARTPGSAEHGGSRSVPLTIRTG